MLVFHKLAVICQIAMLNFYLLELCFPNIHNNIVHFYSLTRGQLYAISPTVPNYYTSLVLQWLSDAPEKEQVWALTEVTCILYINVNCDHLPCMLNSGGIILPLTRC